MYDLRDWMKRSEKYQAFTVAIHSHGKALELGAECPISEKILYLSGVTNLIGEVLRYIFFVIVGVRGLTCLYC